MQTDKYLTLSEMADRLGITAKRFSQDVRDKGIPHLSVGKRMRFDAGTVEAFIATTDKPSNIVKFQPRIKRKGQSKFAEAVGV